MCVLNDAPQCLDIKSTVALPTQVASFSCFIAISPLVKSPHFIHCNEAFWVCVFQDSTLCPLIQQPTTTHSSLTAPVDHW